MSTILSTGGRFTGVAKKTKPILAVQLRHLFPSAEIAALFGIKSLEAFEPISLTNLLCQGEIGEPWQQSENALLKKYNIVGFEGQWMVCEPKPENEVEYFIFREANIRKMSVPDGTWVIQGLWGETIDGVPNLQRVSDGDAVCRQIYDNADQWVVNKDLWKATYSHLRMITE